MVEHVSAVNIGALFLNKANTNSDWATLKNSKPTLGLHKIDVLLRLTWKPNLIEYGLCFFVLIVIFMAEYSLKFKREYSIFKYSKINPRISQRQSENKKIEKKRFQIFSFVCIINETEIQVYKGWWSWFMIKYIIWFRLICALPVYWLLL